MQFNPNDIRVPSAGGLIDINSAGLKPGGIISALFPYIFGAAGIALLIYLVMGGLQLMLSRGDPKAVQAAQAKITSALIGFIIVIIAYTLVTLIGQLLGVGIFSQTFR